MAERLHGVLLAVSGDDADLLRAIDARGSGLRVVRRCADTAELLSAAMAGLAVLVVVAWDVLTDGDVSAPPWPAWPCSSSSIRTSTTSTPPSWTG